MHIFGHKTLAYSLNNIPYRYWTKFYSSSWIYSCLECWEKYSPSIACIWGNCSPLSALSTGNCLSLVWGGGWAVPDPEVYMGTKEWCKCVHLLSVHVQMRVHSQHSQGQANNPALIHHLQPGEFPVWFILRKIHENSPDIPQGALLLPHHKIIVCLWNFWRKY